MPDGAGGLARITSNIDGPLPNDSVEVPVQLPNTQVGGQRGRREAPALHSLGVGRSRLPSVPAVCVRAAASSRAASQSRAPEGLANEDSQCHSHLRLRAQYRTVADNQGPCPIPDPRMHASKGSVTPKAKISPPVEPTLGARHSSRPDPGPLLP